LRFASSDTRSVLICSHEYVLLPAASVHTQLPCPEHFFQIDTAVATPHIHDNQADNSKLSRLARMLESFRHNEENASSDGDEVESDTDSVGEGTYISTETTSDAETTGDSHDHGITPGEDAESESDAESQGYMGLGEEE
jgi:hypothetical protein